MVERIIGAVSWDATKVSISESGSLQAYTLMGWLWEIDEMVDSQILCVCAHLEYDSQICLPSETVILYYYTFVQYDFANMATSVAGRPE